MIDREKNHMKIKNKIISLFIIVSNLGLAQSKIVYTYSGSGNRTMREISFSPFRVGSKDSIDSAKEFPKLLMNEGISVYPNPSKDFVNVSINDFDGSKKNHLTLIDAKGNEILFQTIKSQKTEFNITQIKSGVYYFRLVKNETILYYKLVKID